MIFSNKYTLESNLSLEEALRRIKKETTIGSLLGSGIWSGHYNTFKGKIFNDGFIIKRVTWTKNSSNPIIYGQFFEEKSSLKLYLKLKLHALNKAIFIIVFAAWLFVGLPIAWFFSHLQLGGFLNPVFILLFLIVFFIFSVWIFNSGSRKAKNELMRILDAKELKEIFDTKYQNVLHHKR